VDEKRLEEISARARAARPGPWEEQRIGAHSSRVLAPRTPHIVHGTVGDLMRPPDAAFIAHARGDIPDLLEEVRRLRRELAFRAEQAEDVPPVPFGE
jgi:hypothetical protein